MENNVAIAADTSSPAAAANPVIGTAAALAALNDEPIPATCVAAAVTNSGTATR
ncbi:hypothetical protein MBOU_42720 [Mycobacterium bourgelatii]|uniref:Uncharacterized protein n=1 Tax=Mycobacterium bourgelatii TaxID=1273442 RepID=A0A7I9YU59_MYCBU|nr:hypothetical protein MBOU_42720 [Mycobacterium bourgelatii]